MGGGADKGDASLASASWANARKDALKRAADGGAAAEEEEKEEKLADKVQRMLSPRSLAVTLVSIAWKVASTCITILGTILKALTGRSAKRDMKRIRQQQAAALSS